MEQIRKSARELMKGYCKVCPVCDGRSCPSAVPGMGAAGTGASFRNNMEALARYGLNMRVVHDVTAPKTAIKLLGFDLDMPVLAAPIGGVQFNMGGGVSEDAYIQAVMQGSLDAGAMGCSGDGAPDFIIDAAEKALQSVSGRGIPFIKPWEDEDLFAKLARMQKAGATVVGIDLDSAGLITLAQMGKPVSPKTPAKLADIIIDCDLDFIIKGIMTPGDAEACAQAGAAGIVVSNHGGRVLDHTPGAAQVLPEIAAAVKGDVMILADGGVRSGVDVLKLLALGANAVMIGRPVSVAAVGGLAEGVKKYFEKIKNELISAMILTGCGDAAHVNGDVLCRV